MTSIHAAVPKDLEAAVLEAKGRGEEQQASQARTEPQWGIARLPTPPLSSAGSGLGIQGCSFPEANHVDDNDDESKENDAACSPAPRSSTSYAINTRRQGPAIPLGELEFSHDLETRMLGDEADDLDIEMAFSSEQNIKNNKSSEDSKVKTDFAVSEDPISHTTRPLFSRTRPFPSDFHHQGPSSSHAMSSRHTFNSPSRSTGLTPHLSAWGGVSKPRAVSPPKSPMREMNSKHALKPRTNGKSIDEEARNRIAFEDRLWKLAGGDIRKYNRGDFGLKKTAFDRI